MALDQTTLKNSIKAAFVKAQQTPPPDNPADAAKVQDKILTDLSQDLANAINAFLIGGDITGIKSDVSVNTGTGIGTATQNAVVHVK